MLLASTMWGEGQGLLGFKVFIPVPSTARHGCLPGSFRPWGQKQILGGRWAGTVLGPQIGQGSIMLQVRGQSKCPDWCQGPSSAGEGPRLYRILAYDQVEALSGSGLGFGYFQGHCGPVGS